MSKKNNFLKLIFMVCLVVPFSIDIFLASLPDMNIYFHNANSVLVMSIFLLGFSLSQPFYGPLLDRFGRRPVLLVGLLIFLLASWQLMFVNSFSFMLVLRFVQALGACSAVIAVPAIARDVYQNEELLKAISFIMTMIGVSPAIAPLFGSILAHFFNWRASFVFLFILGAFFISFVFFLFKETIAHKNYQALHVKNIVSNYAHLAKQKKFISPTITAALSYSVMFAYLNLSSMFILKQMHFSMLQYGIIITLNAIPIILMASLTPRIAKRISLTNIMQIGLGFIFIGGIMMWILNNFIVHNIYSFEFPIIVALVGIGLIRPSASASALGAAEKKIAGFASAFFNFTGFMAGAFSSAISSRIIINVENFGVFICFVALLALVIQKFFNKYKPTYHHVTNESSHQ